MTPKNFPSLATLGVCWQMTYSCLCVCVFYHHMPPGDGVMLLCISLWTCVTTSSATVLGRLVGFCACGYFSSNVGLIDVLPVASVLVTDDQPCTAEESSMCDVCCEAGCRNVADFWTLTAWICFDLWEKYWKQLKLVWMLFLFFSTLAKTIEEKKLHE